MSDESMRHCPRCDTTKANSDFWTRKSGKQVGTPMTWCKTCVTTYSRDWKHRTGRQESMKTNRDCPAFLGVNIAERILSGFFNNIHRMPYKNKGYDFICGKGYKIDVKSSCIIQEERRSSYWQFTTRRNGVADYYLCIAFDDRNMLRPLHVWLIPNTDVKKHLNIKISTIEAKRLNWNVYEQPIDKATNCCDEMRFGAKA